MTFSNGFRYLILAILSFIPLQSVRAQQIFPPGTYRVDGIPVNCGNTTTIVTRQLGDVAKATPGNIWIDNDLYYNLPTGVKLFVYAHECGHQIYGNDEKTADCFAVKIGRNQNVISPLILQQICQSVYFSSGDWTHMPGPMRCQNMLMCFMTR